MEAMTFTLVDLRNILGLFMLFGGLIGGGYHLYIGSIKSKLVIEDKRLDGNIKKLWIEKDLAISRTGKMEKGFLERMYRMEIENTTKYATKTELADAIIKIDHHLDRMQDDIADKHKEVLDRLEALKS